MNALHRLLLAAALSVLVYNGADGGGIINGRKANNNKLKFMASVQLDGKHKCGGFLINPSYVLTAAHCDKSGNMTVALGTKNINPLNKNLQRHIVKVEKKYKYQSYKQPKTGGDIMLLKLSKNTARNKDMNIISIPRNNKQVKFNTSCQVAGWGKTETQNTVNDLLVTDVPIISLKTCQEMWKKMNTELPSAVLCAGGYGTKSGACQGDSGGPLVCNGVAVGIVSFNLHKNCDYPNLPNVYTDISKYQDWIKTIIKQGP